MSAGVAKLNSFDVGSKERDSVLVKLKSHGGESKILQFLLPGVGMGDFAHLKQNAVVKAGRTKRSYQPQQYYPPIPPENILAVVSMRSWYPPPPVHRSSADLSQLHKIFHILQEFMTEILAIEAKFCRGICPNISLYAK